ncbi:MAG TPA: YkgJ family cysteine cluster protein [Longimicrobiales bacterium]|nr:YkgJ family cysteine cluster protein [Longimicrobiales bacterium]
MSDAKATATGRPDTRARLEERILADHPRLGPDDTFTFACHPGVPCFNRCCSDVNVFLSPYDVLRLKNRLGMASGEFLDRYALLPVQKEMKTPVVLLRMEDDEANSCPFLEESGCGVYADRPWPCRMYPLGLAASRDTPDGWRGERFHFLLQEEGCQGFEEPRGWTVREWLDDQGIDEYDHWGDAFKELALHPFFEGGGVLSEQKLEMFFTACYDLDRFRRFVFGTTLLERFEVDEDFVEEMRHDDEALLRFAFLWLRYSMFGEPTMKARPEVLEAFRKGTPGKGVPSRAAVGSREVTP